LRAEWDSSLEADGLGPVVRLRGPAQEGPVLCLILKGDNTVFVGRASPAEEGWQQGVFGLHDPSLAADLADLIYDLARDHFAG
jgi:hypothetical protein